MAATVDTTARGLLMPRPMLRPSLAMDTMAMDTVTDMAMAATDTAPAMDTTAVDMVAMDTAAATDTAMAMATTDKKLCVLTTSQTSPIRFSLDSMMQHKTSIYIKTKCR